jgi:hypothetical protein
MSSSYFFNFFLSINKHIPIPTRSSEIKIVRGKKQRKRLSLNKGEMMMMMNKKNLMSSANKNYFTLKI